MGRRHPRSASWNKLINLFAVGIIRPHFFAQIQICHRFVIGGLIILLNKILFEGILSMKKRLLSCIVCICMVLCSLNAVVFAKDSESIVILYENDVHCAVEGYSKLASMKK